MLTWARRAEPSLNQGRTEAPERRVSAYTEHPVGITEADVPAPLLLHDFFRSRPGARDLRERLAEIVNDERDRESVARNPRRKR